jgi:hypothetical protein
VNKLNYKHTQIMQKNKIMDVVKTRHMRELEKRETGLLWKDSKVNGFWDLKDLTVSFHLGKTSSRPATVITVEQKNLGKKCLKND